MTEVADRYSFRKRTRLSYEEAIASVTAALKEEGFGILTEIDVQATFKKKLDVEFPRYIILGACNPHLAHQALNIDEEIGLLLPCNVIVYEGEEGTTISIVDPQAMLGVVPGNELNPVAEEARVRLLRVAQAVTGS